jgi:polyketide synthase 12/epothilone polyketide synthase D
MSSNRSASSEPIAIVGVGCRFPGGVVDTASYWKLLCEGRDAIADIPPDRWDVKALFDANPKTPGKTYVTRGGFLTGIDQFDPEFFGISPREAAHIDPQQRLLLETAYEAMQDAGEHPGTLSPLKTGVFVGLFIHDYQHIQLDRRELLGAYTGTGTAMSIAANRISYAFDLKGPSVAVDTACSSSLVAVHLACQSIRAGESDCALAGGANVILMPEMTIAMSKASMLSPDGRCKAFDSRANGYVRGEGAGIVLLKRLSKAISDGNPIYAVIRGSAVNQDGKTVGISVPSGLAQEALVREACEQGGVSPRDIQYVEAHGTGTPVGDPIEANALGHVLSQGRPTEEPCIIGSVKTNLGHLESASGVAGLIKAALCLRMRSIPKNLHFEKPNPKIDFNALRLRVLTAQEPWPQTARRPRLAGVNSFGFGGTNAHVILEEAPERASASATLAPLAATGGEMLLRLSAHSAEALAGVAQEVTTLLEKGEVPFEDLAYTLNVRRQEHALRAVVSGKSREELLTALEPYRTGAATLSPVPAQPSEGPLFVYTGMGPQWWAMGRELLATERVFREAVERCDRAFLPLTGWSVLAELQMPEEKSRVNDTTVAQPAIFAVQVGLTELWASWGIRPAAVLGHSVGEIAAAWSAGALSFEDAVTVTYHRSRLQKLTAGTGGMLAVGLGMEEARAALAGLEAEVSIAAVNSPKSVTLSGDTTRLDELRASLEARGIFARPLTVEVPYHSVKMEPLRTELLASLANLQPRQARTPLYSTALGQKVSGEELNATYWWNNVRDPVLFSPTLSKWMEDQRAVEGEADAALPPIVEIGPHPVLASSIRDCLDGARRKALVVPSLRRSFPEQRTLFGSLGRLSAEGLTVDWAALSPKGKLVQLPRYPWQRVSCWAESPVTAQQRKGSSSLSVISAGGPTHPLLGTRLGLSRPVWDQTLSLATHEYVRDHRVQGEVVFPGAGYIEMAFCALAPDLEKEDCIVESLELSRALFLPESGAEVRVQFVQTEADGFEVHSRRGEGDGASEAWVKHCAGKARREAKRPASVGPLPELLQRLNRQVPTDYSYSLFKDVGLAYGPCFQGITELRSGRGESLAKIEVPAGISTDGYLFHPALLDTCLHSLFGALSLNGEDADRRGSAYLPVSVGRLRLLRAPRGTLWAHARITRRAAHSFTADIRVYDVDGLPVVQVQDLRCQAIETAAEGLEARLSNGLFEYRWKRAPLEVPAEDAAKKKTVLVLADAEGAALVSALRMRGHTCIHARTGPAFRKVDESSFELDPTSAQDVARLFEAPELNAATLDAVVHAFALSSPLGSKLDLATLLAEQKRGYGSALSVVQQLVRRAPAAPRLWLATSGCEVVTTDDAELRVAQTALLGLHRVLGNEHPALRGTTVDLSTHPTTGELDALVTEIVTDSGEDELALRGADRFVRRIGRATVAPLAPQERAADGQPYSLELGTMGQLDTLTFRPCSPNRLGPNDVEIRVKASALNFKDVLKATGLFPQDLMEENLWSHDTLGMECAGIVERVGSEVKELVPGQRVLAFAPRSFRSHAVTVSDLVAPMPPSLSFEEASSVPIVFLTVYYGLIHLARLGEGERVLIHAAAGGVGQVAIQMAQSVGAEVFATAGSEEKRAMLRGMGIRHVFDSRSPHFADQIREATGGEGVDVVLNSLPGNVIEKSLSLLRDYGRFVEIGKMDIHRNMRLGLRPFNNNLSYFAVDIDRMLAQKPKLCGKLTREFTSLLADGKLRPVRHTAYPASAIVEAFREMATSKHVGKVVVSFARDPVLVSTGRARIVFDPNASYLITGGLGGFGSSLAEWMVERGARHLCLIGRRGAESEGAQRIVEGLRAKGAEVRVMKADTASAADIRRVVAELAGGPPLKGVFHAAGLLDDALLVQQDFSRYEKVAAPKVSGTWNLHEATAHLQLDYFVLFSSIATTVGNQGSGNYAAANAFMDGLAHFRRQRGQKALSVNWGVIADVGMAADEDFYRRSLEANGLRALFSKHGLEVMEVLLEQGTAQATVSTIDWNTWLRFNPAGGTTRYSEVATKGTAAGAARAQSAQEQELRAAILAAPEDQRKEIARQHIRTAFAKLFGFAPEKLDPNKPLTALGMDSLMAVEAKAALDKIGLAMPVAALLRDATVAKLSDAVLESFGHSEAKAPSEASQPANEEKASAGSWIALLHMPRPKARLRLFCFSYAGGGPVVYQAWPDQLPEDVEVCAIHLPGRGSRLGERALTDLPAIAQEVTTALVPMLDRPFAFFGHCMGAILMYEVACALRDRNARLPERLFASGSMAPQLYNSPLVHEQADPKFMEVLNLISFTSTRALMNDAEMRALMFPLLRSDFQAVATYGVKRKTHAPLDVPITGFAALHDLFAAPVAMRGWAEVTTRPLELATLEGDHYFVESRRSLVTQVVASRLGLTATAAEAPDLRWEEMPAGPHIVTELAPSPTGSRPSPSNALFSPSNRQHGEPRLRVVYFPGAWQSESMPTWLEKADLGPDVEVHAVQLAGRGLRRDEPASTQLTAIVDELVPGILALSDRPLVFVAHCMGALVAYEVARRLKLLGAPGPARCVFSGTVGPHIYVAPNAHLIPDGKILDLFQVISHPLAAELRANEGLRREMMPLIRTDLEVMAGYQYVPGPQLDCPITVLAGRNDLWAYPLQAGTWAAHTRSPRVEVQMNDGDHFFPDKKSDIVLAALKRAIGESFAAVASAA